MKSFDPRVALEAKRDGLELDEISIKQFLTEYQVGLVSDQQMAAFLMAVCCRGMSPRELEVWTKKMVDSGELLDLSDLGVPVVDKHSTGGVGDKISLVLVPLLTACGVAVPQMSGRGLGHTGGTLDKLEAIPGWSGNLSAGQIRRQLEEIGCVICAATEELAPLDRRLYAIRDVTGTVASIPLIASSIMSKKIAEGTKSLLLDVKVGSGAFMKDQAGARELAWTMIGIGDAYGVKTAAILTAMDAPLGRAVGNSLEVAEALDVLQGGGPTDVVELVLQQAKAMLDLAGVTGEPERELSDGGALRVFFEMVRAQGGNPDYQPARLLPIKSILAGRSGYLHRLDALAIGNVAWRLGAGRSKPGEKVAPDAGVMCLAKPGEAVAANQPLLELYANDPSRLGFALEALSSTSIVIADEPPSTSELILERIWAGRGGEVPRDAVS